MPGKAVITIEHIEDDGTDREGFDIKAVFDPEGTSSNKAAVFANLIMQVAYQFMAEREGEVEVEVLEGSPPLPEGTKVKCGDIFE
jgi:hypothetical protein